MVTKTFPLANDPKKHFVRLNLWLPFCDRRAVALRASHPDRPLRYFTLCAEDAFDVLLLERNGVLATPSGSYANVTFAALHPEGVTDTLRSIPGARGYAGDLLETVLFEGADPPPLAFESRTDQDEAFFEALGTAESDKAGRASLAQAGLTQQVRAEFPFDVVNLDLCGYTFKNSEDIPGRTVRALRKLLAWQRVSRTVDADAYEVREFTFLYTTRIDDSQKLDGPYRRMLNSAVDGNVATYPDVAAALKTRTGEVTAAGVGRTNKREYFRIAITKLLISTIAVEGWEIDQSTGVVAYEIPRTKPRQEGKYGMLHLAMHLRRIDPAAPGDQPQVPRGNGSPYHQTVRAVIGTRPSPIPKKAQRRVSESLTELKARLKANRSPAP